MKKDAKREATITLLIDSLKEHRLKKGLSINETAWRAGLDHTMIMRVEKRERLPTIDTLLRMAEALSADLPNLLAIAIASVGEKKVNQIKKPAIRRVPKKSTNT